MSVDDPVEQLMEDFLALAEKVATRRRIPETLAADLRRFMGPSMTVGAMARIGHWRRAHPERGEALARYTWHVWRLASLVSDAGWPRFAEHLQAEPASLFAMYEEVARAGCVDAVALRRELLADLRTVAEEVEAEVAVCDAADVRPWQDHLIREARLAWDALVALDEGAAPGSDRP